jgi:hypothetical protein
MAAIVLGASLLLLLALSNGPWAHTTFAAAGVDDVGQVDDDERLDVELHATGRLEAEAGDPELAEQYRSDENAASRQALRGAVPGGTHDLAQVVAVLVALVAAVGVWRDLTPGTWLLLSSASLACLVMVVILRDDVLSALATAAPAMDLGVHDTDPTRWSALAVAGAATAAFGAALATGPRPARPVQPFRAVRRGRSTVPVTPHSS